MEEEKIKLRTIEYILNKYSFNSITLLLFIAISMGITADGCEMTLMALFLIPLKKYYNLSNFQLQIISSILFLGVAIGSYLTGYILAKFRRRTIIINSYIALFIAHTTLSFIPNIIVFSISRFAIGFFLGLIIPISLNSLGEFLPTNNRAFILTSIWLFFSIGQGCNALFMLIGMPNFEVDRMKYVMFSLNSLVIASLILNDNFFIESPRYLIMKGENETAFALLNEMLSKINEDKLSDEEKDNLIKINKKHKEEDHNKENKFITLFTENYFQTTVLSIGIMFIISFLLYGVLVISTLTMKEFNSLKNPQISNNTILANANDTFYDKLVNNTNNNPIKNHIKSDNNINNYPKILIGQIISAFVSMFGNLIGGALCEIPYFGRIKTIYIGFVTSFICSFLVLIIGKDFYTELYSVYLTFVLVAFNVYLTYVVEVYPTKIRDMSSGFLFGCLRMSGFLSQFVYLSMNKIHFLFPYFFTALISFLGAFFTQKLPHETCGQPLDFSFDKKDIEEEEQKLINI